MKLDADLREFIELLNARDVRFLVVGAYALAYHGHPRYTGDIDFFIEPSPDNALRISEVLERFGFADIGLVVEDFTRTDLVVQLGVEPNRMDLMTSISGVGFDEAWKARVYGEIDGLRVAFISKDLLKRNKIAVGRTQDLADIEYL